MSIRFRIRSIHTLLEKVSHNETKNILDVLNVIQHKNKTILRLDQ